MTYAGASLKMVCAKDDKLNNTYFLIIITKIGNSRTLHKFFPNIWWRRVADELLFEIDADQSVLL
jgi:hypothetical protein